MELNYCQWVPEWNKFLVLNLDIKFCPFFFSPGSGISKFLAGMLMESGPGWWVSNKLWSTVWHILWSTFINEQMHSDIEFFVFFILLFNNVAKKHLQLYLSGLPIDHSNNQSKYKIIWLIYTRANYFAHNIFFLEKWPLLGICEKRRSRCVLHTRDKMSRGNSS